MSVVIVEPWRTMTFETVVVVRYAFPTQTTSISTAFPSQHYEEPRENLISWVPDVWVPQYRRVTHWNPLGEPPPLWWPRGSGSGRRVLFDPVLYAGGRHRRANRRVRSRRARRHVNGPIRPGSKR